ncbi:hypothetical protein F5879DRAFT_953952 [Lentinula edodes]|nr:hypothetical protein F5879DRAFT_953952 [Lentinula edodes]
MAEQGCSTTETYVQAARESTASIASLVRSNNAGFFGQDLACFLAFAQADEIPKDVLEDDLPRLSKLKAKYDL